MIQLLAEGGGIALLDVNPGLAIWTTIIFLIVLFILQKFAWKPISRALDERAQKIHSDLDRAEALREDAEKKLAEYTDKLNHLREEGKEIIVEAKKDAEELKEEILSTARVEAQQIQARARKDVELAADAALERLHHEVANLSVEIAGKLIEKDLNSADHKKFVAESIQGMEKLR